MTIVLIVLIAVLAAALAVLAAVHFDFLGRRRSRVTTTGARRILFPFVASALSLRALDAALRLARAEDATLVPVFLARVSLKLPLDAPLPRQSAIAIPLQEAIEQRANAFEIPVDARIERGRTYRHALRQTITHEHFDRIVISASAHGHPGFDPDDVAWLLDNAPGEIVVLRPSSQEQIGLPGSRDGRRPRRRAARRRPRTPAPVAVSSARPAEPTGAPDA